MAARKKTAKSNGEKTPKKGAEFLALAKENGPNKVPKIGPAILSLLIDDDSCPDRVILWGSIMGAETVSTQYGESQRFHGYHRVTVEEEGDVTDVFEASQTFMPINAQNQTLAAWSEARESGGTDMRYAYVFSKMDDPKGAQDYLWHHEPLEMARIRAEMDAARPDFTLLGDGS